MSHKTKLRPLAVALTLAAALAVAAPAEAAGRAAAPGLMAEARAWILELLPTWLRLEAWIGKEGHGIDPDGSKAGSGSGEGAGPEGSSTTTAGADDEHGHGIDPDGL
jgi:hypothetical protein